jgi:hypothetical protein
MMGCVAKVFDRRMCGTRTRASPDGGDVFKLVASAAGVGDNAPFLWAGVVGRKGTVAEEREVVVGVRERRRIRWAM